MNAALTPAVFLTMKTKESGSTVAKYLIKRALQIDTSGYGKGAIGGDQWLQRQTAKMPLE